MVKKKQPAKTKWTRITQKQWTQARRLFREGKVLVDIAKKTNISVGNLSKKAKAQKWTRTNKTAPAIVVPEEKPAAANDETRKQVRTMAGYGLVDEEIAHQLQMPVEVLRETYERELVTAEPSVVARVAQSLFKMATDANKPNVTAAIFWLKCRGGWVEEDAKSMGKKDAQAAAAALVHGGSKFASGRPPGLSVVKK